MVVLKSTWSNWGKQIILSLCFYGQGVGYSVSVTPSFIFEEKESHIVDESPEAQWIGYIGYDFDIDSNNNPCFVYYTTSDQLRLRRGFSESPQVLAAPRSWFLSIAGAVPLGQPWCGIGVMNLGNISQYQGWEMDAWRFFVQGIYPLATGCSIAAGPRDGDLCIMAKVRWNWCTDMGQLPELRTWFRTLAPSWGHGDVGPENSFDSWVGGYEGGYVRDRSVAFSPDSGETRLGGTCSSYVHHWTWRNPSMLNADYWEGGWGCVWRNFGKHLSDEINLNHRHTWYPTPYQPKVVMGPKGITILATLHTFNDYTQLWTQKYIYSQPTAEGYIWRDYGTGWRHMDLVMQDTTFRPEGFAWLAVTRNAPDGLTVLVDAGPGGIMRILDREGGYVSIAAGPQNEPYIALVDSGGSAWLYYFLGNRDGSGSTWLPKSLRCKYRLSGDPVKISLPCLPGYYKGGASFDSATPTDDRYPPVLLKCKKDASGKPKLHFMWYGSDGYLHYARGRMWWW